MSTPAPEQLTLSFMATVVPTGRADGAVLVIPGRVVQTEEMMTVAQVAKATGYSPWRIRQLARSEFGASQHNKRCKLWIPASAVARFKAKKA